MAVITIRIERRAVTDRPVPARSARRRVGIAAAVAATAALGVMGIAGAAPTTSTTDVTFVPLSVPHKVLSGATVAANKTVSAVVIGAATLVPTNATTVRLTVSGKSTTGATLNFYPAANPSGGSGQTLAIPAGSTVVSTTIMENVGESNKLTVANTGPGSATAVTVTITGYSTQVTAGDINGVGGTAGQVLMNNGSGGAFWSTVNLPAPFTATTFVHPTGNASADGTTLRNAILAGPRLVVVEPGTYDMGSAAINVPPATDIVGGGDDNTILAWSNLSTASALITTGNQTISDLQIQVSGGAGTIIGITTTNLQLTLRNAQVRLFNGPTVQEAVVISGQGSLTVENSVLQSSPSTTTSTSVGAVQNNSTGSLTIEDSTIFVSSAKLNAPAYGVQALGLVIVRDSTVNASRTNGGLSYGLVAQSPGAALGNVLADDVQLNADTAAVATFGTGTVRVANSLINGPAVGTPKCVNSYNASYNPVAAGCI